MQITDTQAQVIYEIARERGFWVNRNFAPLEIYGQHTREDYEKRVALNRLTGMGLVEKEEVAFPVSEKELRHVVIGTDGKQYRLRMKRTALAAYDRWVTSSSEMVVA